MLVNFEDVPFGIKVEFFLGSFYCADSAARFPPLRGRATSVVWRKEAPGGAFMPLLKHGRHFVSVRAARNSGCYLYREAISEGGGEEEEVEEERRRGADRPAYFTGLDPHVPPPLYHWLGTGSTLQ